MAVVEAVLHDPEHCPLFVFYDDNQHVYDQRPGLPPNIQVLPLTINFRTTQSIHQQVVYFYRGAHQPLARGPAGEEPAFYGLDYHSIDELRHELTQLRLRLDRGGIRPEQIIILTPLGPEHSALAKLEDVLGISRTPQEGQIQWDTIYRFKGLEREVVIVVEIRRHNLPDALDRLLYVAYSRACHRLYIFYDRELSPGQVSAQTNSRYPLAAITDGLNQAQRDAVTAPLGTALVWAGAGTGKTHVLTQRIAYLLDVHRIDPQHVLAVTFTKRAANEMIDRLGRLLDPTVARRLQIGTFHSICVRMLREEINTLPSRQFYQRTSRFRIVDDDDGLPFLKEAIDQNHIDTRAHLSVEQIRRYISRQKSAGRLPHESPAEDERESLFRTVYMSYQDELEKADCLDFDDLILLAVRLLEEYEAVRSRRQRRWPHILVDEFQDTNVPQFRLIELLTDHHENNAHSLLVVGDAQQSIYGWRGARYDLFRDFSQRFKNTDEHRLTINYRSTLPILDVAAAIGQREYTGVDALDLTPHEKRYGVDVSIIESRTISEESGEVARRIRAAIDEGVESSDIAVLLRSVRGAGETSLTMKGLEESLHLAGIAFERRGIQSFYGNPVIRGLIIYLRALCDPTQNEYLEPVLLHPLFAPHIGSQTVQTLRAAGSKQGVNSLWTFLTMRPTGLFETNELQFARERVIGLQGIGGVRLNALEEMVDALQGLRVWLPVQSDITPVLQIIRERTRFDARFRTEDNAEEFTGLIRSLCSLINEDLREGQDLLTILNTMAMFGSIVDEPPRSTAGGKVQIMTIHASKGLEFHTVFVLGLEEGTMPSALSLLDPEQQLEEGRVCYVALTRARRHLIVSYVEQRELSEVRPISRFLEAIRARVDQHQFLEDLSYARVPTNQEALMADMDNYRNQPAIVQLDATNRAMSQQRWHRLERALMRVPGAFPVEVIVLDDDGCPQIVEMNTCVRGDQEALIQLRDMTGCAVSVISHPYSALHL